MSSNLKLYVDGEPTLGRPELDPIYRPYVEYLTTFGTNWIQRFEHDIDEAYWIDDLEVPASALIGEDRRDGHRS